MSKGLFIYLGGFELPDGNAAAHRVVANAKILRDLGYEVLLIGIRKSGTPGLVRHNTDYHGFECWSVPYPAGHGSWLRYISGLRSILAFVSGRPGVSGLICYNYPALAQLRLFRLCRSLGVRAIADATEWYEASGGNFLFRLVKTLDTWLRMRVANRVADGVITTSRYVTQMYECDGKLTVELPTLFDTEGIPQPPKGPAGRARTFIYLGCPFSEGRVNKHRTNMKDRLDECIRLFHELHSKGYLFQFDIYGISAEEYLRVLPEQRDWLDALGGKVRFHGRIPNSVVRERIASSDFSIFFRDESRVVLAGFPTKLAESISFGTPVVASRMQNVEKYCSEAGFFLASKGEERAVIESSLRLADAEIDALKAQCFTSRIFDYRAFESSTRQFLTALGLK